MRAHDSHRAPVRCVNWIEGLINNTKIIAEWETDDEYWIRLAVLTCANAHILRLVFPDAVASAWLPSPGAIETNAIDHFRTSLRDDLVANKQPLPKALRAGLRHAHATLPRSFRPWSANAHAEEVGRWLVGLGLRLGLESDTLAPDFATRLERTCDWSIDIEHYLCTRLLMWHDCSAGDVARIEPVRDFLIWFHRNSVHEAAIMPGLVALFPELGTPEKPVWNPSDWLNAGWKAAPLLVQWPEYGDLLESAPADNIALTRRLYRELSGKLSPTPRYEEIAQGALSYMQEFGYDQQGPGCNALLCYRAFDYSLWMRLAHEQHLPDPVGEFQN